MTDLAALVVRMQADNSQYIKALDQATGKLNKFAHDQEGLVHEIGEKFSEFVAEFAAAFTIDKLVEFTASAIESAASLEKLSQASGISVESLSSLRLAAAASGLTQDELGVSLKKLNVNLAEAAGNASSKAGVAFKALGISITDSNGRVKDAGVVMGDLAAKFATFADGPNKTAIAVQLFGKAGQQMIPMLNQGAEGLKELKDQAAAAGLVMSSGAAIAAEDLERKFAILKATVVDSFGIQLQSVLLPTLSAVGDAMLEAGRNGEAMGNAAAGLGIIVKLVASFAIQTAGAFERLGTAIGAISGAAVSVAKLRFAEAANIYAQGAAANIANRKWEAATIESIMDAGTDRELSIISTAEAEKKRIRAQAPNTVAAEETIKAIAELQKYSDALKGEAAAFGLGKAALIEYKLQYGPLADAIGVAGKKGQELAAEIRKNATVLQIKIDDKAITTFTNSLQEQVLKYGQSELAAEKYKNTTGDLGAALDRMADHGVAARAKMDALAKQDIWLKDQDALEAIDRQTLTTTGHLQEAAAAAFDFSNKLLIKNVTDTGDLAGQAKLASLKAQTIAQAAYGEQVEKTSLVQQQLATTEAQIALEQSTGQITEMQAQAQIETARATAIDQLNRIYVAEKRIADDSGLPKLVQQTQAFENSITSMAAQQGALTKQIRADLENSLVSPLTDAEMGTKSLKAAFADMAKSIERDLLTIANKNIAESIFGTGGSAGGAAGLLAGLLGGAAPGSGIASTGAAAVGSDTGLEASKIIPAFASGGTLDAGKVGLVGEAGPELVYSGSQNMNVIPAGGAGKQQHITQHFIIQAPGGTISRQSQMQTAAAAARSLAQANRRNNT